MLKKINVFLEKPLTKLKILMPTLHSSEVVSVFSKFYDWFAEKNPDIDDVLNFLTSFFIFLVSLGLLGVLVFIYLIIGG